MNLIRKSPWLFHYNTGSCNGCDIEIVAALCPKQDAERFGAILVPSPRHADVFVVTGPVTEQSAPRLKALYDQIPSPKKVVVVGSCGCSGGIFRDNYCVKNGIDQVIPVDMYVAGCAARPEAILNAIVKVLSDGD